MLAASPTPGASDGKIMTMESKQRTENMDFNNPDLNQSIDFMG